jgi:hypothetical protein
MGGKPLADSWHQIMTNRDFYIKYTKNKVKWRVGQPLGLLSSFPSFALWHHDIVQLAANWELLHGGKPLKFFSDYRLLGDDIVIFDTKVAVRYQWLLKKINIPINLSKSVIGEKGNSQIEFTKRLALRCEEMSSLKYNILSKDNILDMLDLVEILIKRDFISLDTGHYGLSQVLNSEDSQRLKYLLWLRASDTPELILTDQNGNVSVKFTRSEIMKTIIRKRTTILVNKSMNVDPMNMEKIVSQIIKEFKSTGVPHSETALVDDGMMDLPSIHPIIMGLAQTSRELHNCQFTVMYELDPNTVSPVEYLPEVSAKSYFHDRKAAVRYLSKILMDTFDEHRRNDDHKATPMI